MTTTKTARQLRAEWQAEIARREAEIAAAEREEDRRTDEALRRAGRARVAAVEILYELLGVDEQTTTRTRRDGSIQTVRVDRDETERAERLVDAVRALLAHCDGLRSAPAESAPTSAPLPSPAGLDATVSGREQTAHAESESTSDEGWAA
ncbi:hypothetical protein FDF08_10905 [Micrococcus luteus]|nr:hypothetical protein FDF08_10905 [Micrococcus luteus]